MSNDMHDLIIKYVSNFTKLKDLDRDIEKASNKIDTNQVNSQQESNKE